MERFATTRSRLIPSGLRIVGDVPWGTHICQLYRDQDGLVDALVSYFKAGLENHEQCLWITSEPLLAKDAWEALRRALPSIDIHDQQIEILAHDEWYIHLEQPRAGESDLLQRWLEREERARQRGFTGLRIAGNASGLTTRQCWDAFADYEARLHRALYDRRIIALCSYFLDTCQPDDIIDLLRTHSLALVQRNDTWEAVQSATLMLASVPEALPPLEEPPPCYPWASPAVCPHDGSPTTSLGSPASGSLTRTGSDPLGTADHTVHLYPDGAFPVARVAQFLADGLRAGQTALAVPLEEHLEPLIEALLAQGVDVSEARQTGRLVLLAARATLSRFMDGCNLDAPAFERGVMAALEPLLATAGRVRAYGEMVNVLSRQGNLSGALQIEQAWNQLLQGRPVTLMCAYGLSEVGPTQALEQVYQMHSQVFPADPPGTSSDPRDTERLRITLEHAKRSLHAESERRRQLEIERDRLLTAERSARARAQIATEHLARLQRVTSHLSVAATQRDIARVVVTEMAEVIGADQAMLVLPVAGGDLMLVDYEALDEHAAAELACFPADAPFPVASAFRTGRPVYLSVTEMPGFMDQLEQMYPTRDYANNPLQAIACLPLALAGQRLGAIGLGFHAPQPFSLGERALLGDLARQVALALERARLFEQAKHTRDRLQLLADASTRIYAAKLDLARILDAVADVTRQLMDCCGIFLRSADSETLELTALRYVSPELEARVRELLANAPVELGRGSVGTVVSTGEALLMPVVTARDRERMQPEHRACCETHPVHSLVVVPMRTSAVTIGALVAARLTPDAPITVEDRELLQDLADRASLAIYKALLYADAQRQRQRAEAASKAKDEFLAMLGHELRNPLSPILTALQLMQLRGGDIMLKERAVIERQVKHMVRLIDDLLDVSRITRGKTELERTVVELAEVVSAAIEMASPLLEQRAHTLHTSVPASGLPVLVDPHRLAQVVGNLLTNAARYTAPGGHIHVHAGIEGSRVVLWVRDNGVGIALELLPNIFDLFVQGRRGPDRAEGGLGLGLAIVRSLVELHGGSVHARSDGPGRGSQFTIELPLVTRTPARPSVDEPAARAMKNAQVRARWTRRILVVDDNRDAADALAEALRALGHQVRVSYDPPAALTMAESFVPDVAILDIGLPVMDGYQLAGRMLAQLGANPPKLVAVTGYGLDTDRARTQTAGFQEHLVKPVDLTRLGAVIDRLCDAPAVAGESAR